jgi:hypothetical protein
MVQAGQTAPIDHQGRQHQSMGYSFPLIRLQSASSTVLEAFILHQVILTQRLDCIFAIANLQHDLQKFLESWKMTQNISLGSLTLLNMNSFL